MKSAISAALIVLGVGITGIASALPRAPAVEADGLVEKVQIDCLADVRRHYLPQYDGGCGTATASRTAG